MLITSCQKKLYFGCKFATIYFYIFNKFTKAINLLFFARFSRPTVNFIRIAYNFLQIEQLTLTKSASSASVRVPFTKYILYTTIEIHKI